YESDCPDGSMRTVELVLKDFCGGTVSRTRTYVAPLDRSQFKPVGIRLGDAEVGSTKEVVIPVLLETPVNEIFSKSDISIGYDHNVLQCTGISTDGTLLEGHPVSAQLMTSTVLVHCEENMEMNTAGGVLFYVHFRAGDVANVTFTPLYLINWDFHAYCLTPMLRNGRIKILPREPRINCEVSAPDALIWNDEEKRYEPNPFDVSVTVYNTGSKEAWNVQAVLVTDPDIVELVTPTVNVQKVTPSIVPPGGSATAHWRLLATKQQDLDSIPIYFSVTSDNHPTIACWHRIVVDPALSSALVCDISAPDTIFFREQYYEPEEFDIHVRAQNVGSGQTKDVRAQLLQDTRFTIIPPAHRQLAEVLLPSEETSGTFRVQIHPRETDGYDTVHVNIQGDDTNPAWCSYPIWVQRVRMPEFTLLCSTPDDSLVFSDQTYDYVPNPFVVTTVAENIGETYAEDCQIMFVGPPSFTPVGSNPRPAGTMQIGNTRTEQWTVRALPRSTAVWDTLVFQVMGRGGLGRQIVIAECRLPVYVPAVRRPEYTLVCSVPDTLTYTENRYQPDPLLFSMRITNTGNAVGRGLTPTIVLPPSVSLAEGETAGRYVPALGIGQSSELEWRLHPEMRANDGTYRICAQVLDSIGVTEQCCSDVFIPKTEDPIIMPSCWSVDTLFIDTGTGEYLGNPFEVILNLTNIGLGTAENVRVTINVLGSFMTVVDDIEKTVGDLASSASVRVTWNVEALRREAPADIPILLTVTSDNHPSRECQLSVHVPATQRPLLDAICSSIPEDSLYFDWDIGDFAYPECSLLLTVTNNGAVDAHNVQALLIVPSGVLLADGEITQKSLTPSLLKPGESGSATWRFRAKRSNDDMIRSFRFIVRADDADDAECIDEVWVQGSPKHVTLSLPEYVLLHYGEKRDIPILIDRTIGKDLSEYTLQFHYDPEILALLGVNSKETLTGIGWVGAKMTERGRGHIEISDYTTGSPLATDPGVLLNLQVEGIFNENSSRADYGESIIAIDSVTSLLNRGEIDLRTELGRVIATNQCLEPLLATENFTLLQNRPNPFNPQTLIEFHLPQDDFVRLVVFDTHGREIAILADGYHVAGDHAVNFSADQLPSGLYFYRLETPRRFEMRKMILSR
ncbi:MAG: T9SS type A sorting domain-containing protein, partial [Bacteroidetes bacterium]|nr:T9SS type A sorting domain-containing protein [Bacteroidota bacterium]